SALGIERRHHRDERFLSAHRAQSPGEPRSPRAGSPRRARAAARRPPAVGGAPDVNVFYIPSWYPDPSGRVLDGIFFQEMARALVRHRPEIRMVVSLWGQTERNLSIARMRFLLRHPAAALDARPPRAEIQPRLVELYRPTWSWRYRTSRGNAESILRANRQSFLEARAECGAIDLIHAQVSFPAGYIANRLGEEMGVPH